jgi:hypothetical protein
METNFTASPQTLLDGVVATIREQVIAEMAVDGAKTCSKTPRNRLLTAEQAGVYLGRTPGAVRQLIHRARFRSSALAATSASTSRTSTGLSMTTARRRRI